MNDSEEILNKLFMREAFKQAERAFEEDEVPVGAVITFKNKVIAKAYNQVEKLKDPTAHAEMIAITQATNSIGSKWLQECSMFVTLEPCSMCAGALVLARVGKIYYGASDPKTGACGSIHNIANHPKLNHQIEIVQGILEDECSSILTHFFDIKRRAQNRLMN